jgi:hypothetical protein
VQQDRSVTDGGWAGRPYADLHVLTLALETMEQDLEAATDPAEHRELTEQIRMLAARIDALIGIGPAVG